MVSLKILQVAADGEPQPATGAGLHHFEAQSTQQGHFIFEAQSTQQIIYTVNRQNNNLQTTINLLAEES